MIKTDTLLKTCTFQAFWMKRGPCLVKDPLFRLKRLAQNPKIGADGSVVYVMRLVVSTLRVVVLPGFNSQSR